MGKTRLTKFLSFMKVLQQVNRLFVDSAPVIYYIDMNPNFFPIVDEVFNYVELNSICLVTLKQF